MLVRNYTSEHIATYCNNLLLHRYNKFVIVKTTQVSASCNKLLHRYNLLVLTILYREQKYTRIVTIISCRYLLKTKIYWQEQKYT
jgi:hypothetical protein